MQSDIAWPYADTPQGCVTTNAQVTHCRLGQIEFSINSMHDRRLARVDLHSRIIDVLADEITDRGLHCIEVAGTVCVDRCGRRS